MGFSVVDVDSRSGCYLPSVLATATMMHVIDQVETFNPIDYQTQLLDVLKITKVSFISSLFVIFVSYLSP